MTVWVSLPYATYGIEVEGGVVTDAAPIARWMIGKKEDYVRKWVLNKGGEYHPLEETI